MAMATATATAASASGVATLGVMNGDGIDKGYAFSLELANSPIADTTTVYSGASHATSEFCYYGCLTATTFTVGGSFATGTPIKPRIGLTYNRYQYGSYSDSEIGAEVGAVFVTNSGLAGTVSYNTELESTIIGLGFNW